MGIRSTRDQRLVQQGRDYTTNFVRNTHLVKSSRVIGEIVARKASVMLTNALTSVDTRWFLLFKKMSFGRVCSCTSQESSSPSDNCNICYGTGFVGGYEKYGTWTEVLDYTRDMDLINIEPAYDLGITPTLLRLVEGAKKGVISVTIPIRANAGFTDAFDYIDSISDPANSGITIQARESGTNTWFPVDAQNTASLDPMLGAASIDIKVIMTRRSAEVPTPYFQDLKWRYGLVPRKMLSLPVDIPRNTEGVSLLDYGFDENFGSLNVSFDNRVQTLSNGDLLYYVNRNRWLCITEVQPFQAVDTFIAIDATARFMQTYEAGTRVMI